MVSIANLTAWMLINISVVPVGALSASSSDLSLATNPELTCRISIGIPVTIILVSLVLSAINQVDCGGAKVRTGIFPFSPSGKF